MLRIVAPYHLPLVPPPFVEIRSAFSPYAMRQKAMQLSLSFLMRYRTR